MYHALSAQAVARLELQIYVRTPLGKPSWDFVPSLAVCKSQKPIQGRSQEFQNQILMKHLALIINHLNNLNMYTTEFKSTLIY